MKIKIYKAPNNLRERIDNKINILEGVINLGELFFKNLPISLFNSLSSENKKKK